MKIMRKALSVLLVLVLMISSPVHAAFTTNHTDKTIGEVSLGEIQDALMDYFENNSILFAALKSIHFSGSKPFTSAATFTL